MCGRYADSRSGDDLALEFEAEFVEEDLPAGPPPPANFNVAPTDPIFAVRMRVPKESGGTEPRAPYRELSVARWGLVPSWAKDRSIASKMFNARVESLTDKPAFRKAFAKRRALIPADGWYEWTPRADGPGKQPYFMTPRDGSGLAFAGLWEIWGTKPDLLLTATIITIPAQGPLAEIHDRMPFVLPRERWAEWLALDTADPEQLLEPTPMSTVAALEIRPIGAAVGKVANNGPQLTGRVEDSREPAAQDLSASQDAHDAQLSIDL